MRLVALALGFVLLAAAFLVLPMPPKTDGAAAGDFDYYLLALSWSPNWCAETGDSQGAPECSKPGLTFTLHGLWPQYDAGGYPSDCRSTARDPSRADTAAMQDIMGSASLAWHEWQAHGRCSGLASDAYLALMRKAYTSITVPPLFAEVSQSLQVAPKVIQDAFLASNPSLTHQTIAVTCDRQMIKEVRICLTKDLAPRPCGGEMHHCTMSAVELGAVR